MVLYGTQCTGTWYRKSTAYPYTEYREVYIRYLGLKFGDMDRRLRSIPVSDLCVWIPALLKASTTGLIKPTDYSQD